MGFQLVASLNVLGEDEMWLILTGEIAVGLGNKAEFEGWVLARGALSPWWPFFAAARVPALDLRAVQLMMQRTAAGYQPNPGRLPTGAVPARSALVTSTTTDAGQKFYRFSSSSSDARVDPTDGHFVRGTYATTSTDIPMAPSGFAAVGRYALPNVQPASYRYEIEPSPGTKVEYGTVAPAYGQSGGGVEVLFPDGAVNVGTHSGPVKLPDA